MCARLRAATKRVPTRAPAAPHASTAARSRARRDAARREHGNRAARRAPRRAAAAGSSARARGRPPRCPAPRRSRSPRARRRAPRRASPTCQLTSAPHACARVDERRLRIAVEELDDARAARGDRRRRPGRGTASGSSRRTRRALRFASRVELGVEQLGRTASRAPSMPSRARVRDRGHELGRRDARHRRELDRRRRADELRERGIDHALAGALAHGRELAPVRGAPLGGRPGRALPRPRCRPPRPGTADGPWAWRRARALDSDRDRARGASRAGEATRARAARASPGAGGRGRQDRSCSRRTHSLGSRPRDGPRPGRRRSRAADRLGCESARAGDGGDSRVCGRGALRGPGAPRARARRARARRGTWGAASRVAREQDTIRPCIGAGSRP